MPAKSLDELEVNQVESIQETLKVVLWSLLEAYGVEIEDLEIRDIDFSLTQASIEEGGITTTSQTTCWRQDTDGRYIKVPC